MAETSSPESLSEDTAGEIASEFAAERDAHFMRRAVAAAADARLLAPPNPWVGCVVVAVDGTVATGCTEQPGGRHAEIVALHNLAAVGVSATGSTVFTTLEPCSHEGRTGPCTAALIEAGVSRVVVGLVDPDPQVAGQGVALLEAAGIIVNTGCEGPRIATQLAPYLTHRRTGRPLVVLKLAGTLDGYLAASDGTSKWITGAEARSDTHRLRAESGAIVVGAGTVRADNPSLTVRDFTPSIDTSVLGDAGLDPLRVVLGSADPTAKIHPVLEHGGELDELLDELGAQGVLQVLVEGGGAVAGSFHRAGLVDRYVLYLAPAFLGGGDGVPLLSGPGIITMSEMRRGRFESVVQLGRDLRVEVVFDSTD